MITEGILSVIFGLIDLVVSAATALVPPVPAFVGQAVGAMATVWSWVSGFETWIPIQFGLICVGAVGAAYVAGLVVGIVRVVASYLTLGGGAT